MTAVMKNRFDAAKGECYGSYRDAVPLCGRTWNVFIWYECHGRWFAEVSGQPDEEPVPEKKSLFGLKKKDENKEEESSEAK